MASIYGNLSNAPQMAHSQAGTSHHTSPSTQSSRLSLSDLLPAGTVIMSLPSGASMTALLQDIELAEDGWYAATDLDNLIQCGLDHSLQQRLQDLRFLQDNQFIAATFYYSPTSSMIVTVRVYLIPYDLPNMQGRLRKRDSRVLNTAKRALEQLYPRIDQDAALWSGDIRAHSPSYMPLQPILPFTPDSRTMAEIYGDLPSPRLPIRCGNPHEEIIDSVLTDETLPGMRSSLYLYQKRSVAAMLEMEHNLNTKPDPLYLPLVGMNGRTFYFQPGTMELVRECPMISPNRGGILCEELGTGKTVMILALILTTLDELSSPDDSFGDTHEIFSPLSIRCFPRHCSLFSSSQETKSEDCTTRCPTLLENMIHFIRASPVGLSLTEYQLQLEQRNLWQPVLANTPFYLHLETDFTVDASSRRLKQCRHQVKYLTAATLIIVPPNLLLQWQNEIMKHLEYPIRLLVLKDNNLPPAQKLASEYDIVMMTNQRFSQEAKLLGGESENGFPDCKCPNIEGLSPLHQIRWKRLVLDEGHNSASHGTNFIQFSKLLSVERRWIVTGTPTRNLLGLSFGQNSGQDSTSASSVQTPELHNMPSRVWTAEDRVDLRKLSNMMIHFLQMPQFKMEPTSFSTRVTEPLLGSQGPRPGAIKVLTQVLTSTMIRHRIEDVEKDVALPPLVQETVLLSLDPYAIHTYNVQQALIAINAIDSQRTDQDYMFHPRNAAFLRQTIENMSQILFWHRDEEAFDYELENTIKRAESALTSATNRHQSDNDISLMTQTLQYLHQAVADQTWRHMQHTLEVPYRIINMPDMPYQAWQSFPPCSSGTIQLLTPGRVLAIRKLLISQPLMSMHRLSDYAGYVIREEQRYEIPRQSQASPNKLKKNQGGRDDNLKAQATHVRKIVATEEKTRELGREFEKAQEKWNGVQPGGPEWYSKHSESTCNVGSHSLLASSPMATTKIGDSVSVKLNYILNEVLNHSKTEKFLIFSKLPFTLAHIEEGLELAGIKYLRFTTDVPQRVREQFVTTFETSDVYRIFLMELKHGARGLNLVSASRVIFCEPVWHADVEIQAIKRAHRIGQTRAINVKTLAIKSSFEQIVLARKALLRGTGEKLPGLEEEAGIRDFLKNPTFMTQATTDAPAVVLQMPLLPIPKLEDQREIDTQIAVTNVQSCHAQVTDSGSPRKKVKLLVRGVHFA